MSSVVAIKQYPFFTRQKNASRKKWYKIECACAARVTVVCLMVCVCVSVGLVSDYFLGSGILINNIFIPQHNFWISQQLFKIFISILVISLAKHFLSPVM